MQSNSSVYEPLLSPIFSTRSFDTMLIKNKKACFLNKQFVTKFHARASVHCTQAFIFPNFVTECLLKVGMFMKIIMESLDLDKNGLECGAWIDGYNDQKKGKKKLITLKEKVHDTVKTRKFER